MHYTLTLFDTLEKEHRLCHKRNIPPFRFFDLWHISSVKEKNNWQSDMSFIREKPKQTPGIASNNLSLIALVFI